MKNRRISGGSTENTKACLFAPRIASFAALATDYDLAPEFDLLLSLGVEVRDSACGPYSFVAALRFNTLWYLAIPL